MRDVVKLDIVLYCFVTFIDPVNGLGPCDNVSQVAHDTSEVGLVLLRVKLGVVEVGFAHGYIEENQQHVPCSGLTQRLTHEGDTVCNDAVIDHGGQWQVRNKTQAIHAFSYVVE